MKYKGVLRGVVAVVISIVMALLSYYDVLSVWDKSLWDNLNQEASGVNKKIYIIGINDKTLEKYGNITSWGRELSGKLVEKLNENKDSKPAVVAFDIIYSESANDEGDLFFAEECRKSGNVVVASSFTFKEQPETDENGETAYNQYHVEYMLNPYEELSKSVETGFANSIIDEDGYVRRARVSVDYNGETFYSFASKIYMQYQKAQGEEIVFPKTFGAGKSFYFSYSGNPGAYTVVSMADVLDGTVDTRIFKDAIVFIGAYAVGMQDNFKTAVNHSEQMYGVEVHANIVQALLEGKTQVPVSRTAYAIIFGLLCGAFFVLIDRIRILWSTVALFGVLVGNVLLVKLMYQWGYVMPFILFSIAMVLIYLQQLIEGYVTELRRRRRVVSVFKQYVAPQIVDKISKNKDFELVLGGENRDVAVLFVDIRGFTTLSESLEPEQVVEILNEYLSLTTKAVFDNDGTLDKFVGDATMAVFNAPFDLDDYIFKAVLAAWDMKQGADEIADKFEERFGKKVEFGIGIHCGNAVVGNIGCDFRMDYTAIGDTVNTAARLESNAKQGQILISEKVYEAVKDRVTVTPIGEITLKGKNKGVFVYQIDDVVKEK